MSNLTLALDDELLETARKYAATHGSTLNNLIRRLLEKTVLRSSTDWVDELDRLFDELEGDSRGQRWTRDDLHVRGGMRTPKRSRR